MSIGIATCFLGGGGVVVATKIHCMHFLIHTIVTLKSEIHTLKLIALRTRLLCFGLQVIEKSVRTFLIEKPGSP